MDTKIRECLDNKHGSYILPFLWLHGEPKERVKEEILAIKNSGINEFCAESRPYEDFCREAWWDDFGFILETAKELGMRVWLLDDQKFPTGYANGYLELPQNAHLRKRLIREFQIEVIGPMKSAKLFVGGRVEQDEKVLQVIAYKHATNEEAFDYTTAVDLTPTLKDGMVYWDVPKGVWRACVTVETPYKDSYNGRFPYYIDMLSAESCHAMIDAIYQPHYEHFSKYFGNTFAGFFSDEPGFLNVIDTYYNKLGIINSPYPWREDMPTLIAESAGIDEEKARLYIPALWEELGEVSSLMRMHYMEVVTRLYSENFSHMLGNWCREHGVMYIGHVIEDMNAHMRLGYGSGHFFRALDGQDMAGIDIVLMQDVPGICDNIHRTPLADGGRADPSFFRYTLPKLASSHSHIQPLKKGRAMCEIFGAFGWAEGLPYMKGLADTMLASGVNYFVPHAFSPKEDDEDCPPHFYNGGKNIQYPLFKSLMQYMGRCSHMLNGGTHKADVAVFYNAEGEWTGGENQPFSEICRTLTQGTIDFDIVPFDALKEANVENGRLQINNEDYGALVVSRSEIMPLDRLKCFEFLSKKGLKVIFTDSLPRACAESEDISSILNGLECVPTSELVKCLREAELCQISAEGENTKSLRFYHVTRDERDIYLFSNEAIYGTVDVDIKLPQKGECLIYEPWSNRIYRDKVEDGIFHLKIENGNMLFLIFGEKAPSDTPFFKYEKQRQSLPLTFDIFLKEEGKGEFEKIATNSACFDISAPDKFPNFCGEIRYESTFVANEDLSVIDLGQVGEVAEVWLNGEYLGARINAPYKFAVGNALKNGENKLEILVRNNLGHRRRDWFSSFIQFPPSGLLGDISACKY